MREGGWGFFNYQGEGSRWMGGKSSIEVEIKKKCLTKKLDMVL